MRSPSGRSTGRSTDPSPKAGGVDVYLFPAVVGGGLGDIEEVLAAGRYLARAGFRPILYREERRPLPANVDGPWEWPPVVRQAHIVRRAATALTVAPSWGVSAGPSRPVRFGRGGPWEVEARNVEAAYGPERTLHVSLEEFARTLPSEAETRERFREGGVPARAIGPRYRAAESAHEVEAFRSAFRSFRGFDRSNVLHLFATFRPDPVFGREFPEAVQTGPLLSGHSVSRHRAPRKSGAHREWVWYASPASAERIAPSVVRGLAGIRPPITLYVRSPRPWPSFEGPLPFTFVTTPVASRHWRSRFRRADLRIVTGSRTLLEAMEVGGPFLYFNGVLGRGPSRRRHRPEKIRAWLDLAGRAGVSPALRRDLADFARGRRIVEVVRRAARQEDGWGRFPSSLGPAGFPASHRDAGRLVVAVARELARPGARAPEIVARWRGSNP
ncbi:MAG TPA: hypothetical protein VK423_06320 [Thermoplasmata archaeon]|nr:hypothetical protein [Thermoplasmata archaeon]